MPKSITTFCTASRSHLAVKSRTPHIWVSEDVLSETFSAFVRNHKRFGSNVPGPLEARKRASKRRATHLAHQSATNYNPESFGLFDAQSQQGWWQKTGNSYEHQVTSWPWPFQLPQVFTGPPPPPPKPFVREDELDVLVSSYGELSLEDAEGRLREHLYQVRTHTATMDMLAELSISLKHLPDLANTILKYMIAEHWDHEEIAEYLLDPRSNSAGTANHFYVLKHAQHHLGLITWLLRRGVFVQAARLGLLEVTAIQKILLLIPKSDISIFPEASTWASFSVQLMDAMDESKVLSVADLGEKHIQRWLEEMPLYSFCPAVPQLLWRLHKFAGSSDQSALEAVLYTSIRMVREKTICHLHGLVDFMSSRQHKHLAPVILSLTNQLCEEAGPDTTESLPTTSLQQRVDWLFRRNLLQRVRGIKEDPNLPLDEDAEVDVEIIPPIPKVKELEKEARRTFVDPEPSVLQELCQQRLNGATKLELWYAVLGNLSATSVNQFGISTNTLRKFLGISHDGGDAQQRSLTALWVSMVLTIHDDGLFQLSGVPRVIETELRRTFLAATEIGKEHILANICRALQLSPLPAKNKLLRRLHALSRKSVDVKRNYWNLSTHLNDLDNIRILELRNDVAYRSVKQHFPEKLTEIAECLNTDMAKFEKTCIDIVKHAKGSINIVFRLLDNNKELQVALRKAGAMKRSDPERWEHAEAALRPAFGGYSYVDLVKMIHSFAREISRSDQLSPRNALRRVYSIRGYLLSCRAPVHPSLAKALWHAGVTRFDNERRGSCYKNVRWLYSMISKESGEAEADRVLHWSGKTDVPDLHDGPRTSTRELCEEYPRDTGAVDDGRVLGQLEVSDRFGLSEVSVFSAPFCSVDEGVVREGDFGVRHPSVAGSLVPKADDGPAQERGISVRRCPVPDSPTLTVHGTCTSISTVQAHIHSPQKTKPKKKKKKHQLRDHDIMLDAWGVS